MESIKTHLITCFVLVLIPYVTSLSFVSNFVGTRNRTTEANIQLDGAYISEAGIQLTPDLLGSNPGQVAGRVTYYKPFRLYDRRSNGEASFSTNFTFVIDSNGSANYSYGLTFFLADSNTPLTADGNMGLPMASSGSPVRFRFVAVEFDTFWDQ
ncbi:lectin-like [Bidens hawaiensis]|uniref:lectin-like n=1 Tax=Bidens hawaiensis TaxID=980011 RepID=UPI00404997CF